MINNLVFLPKPINQYHKLDTKLLRLVQMSFFDNEIIALKYVVYVTRLYASCDMVDYSCHCHFAFNYSQDYHIFTSHLE